MKKILLLTMLITNSVIAENIIFENKIEKDATFKILINTINNKYPKLKEDLKYIKSVDTSNKKVKDGVYMLISESIPNNILKEFIISASFLNYYFNTYISFVVQGFYSKEFILNIKKISEEFDNFEYGDIFKNNFEVIINPSLFKDLGVNKVPILLFSDIKDNETYPSAKNVKYMIKGDVSLKKFFYLISKDEVKYEKYYNIINNI